MSVMVLACYKPKTDKDNALLTLLKTHLPTLRKEGLVGEGPSLCGRAKDGTYVEVFCWKSQSAIDAAHTNEVVGKMWNAFAEVCDFTVIADVEGAKDMFTALMPIDLA